VGVYEVNFTQIRKVAMAAVMAIVILALTASTLFSVSGVSGGSGDTSGSADSLGPGDSSGSGDSSGPGDSSGSEDPSDSGSSGPSRSDDSSDLEDRSDSGSGGPSRSDDSSDLEDRSDSGSGGPSRSDDSSDLEDRSDSGSGGSSHSDDSSDLEDRSDSGSGGSSGQRLDNSSGRQRARLNLAGIPVTIGPNLDGGERVNQGNKGRRAGILEMAPTGPGENGPRVIERVRHLEVTDGVATAIVSLILLTDELRGRVRTRDFPRPNSSIDRAALCLTTPGNNRNVLFIGDNRIDWDDEDEAWRMSDQVKPEVNFETLVGARLEIVNIGPKTPPKPDRDDACANRDDGDVVLTKVLTVNEVEILDEPMLSPLAAPAAVGQDQGLGTVGGSPAGSRGQPVSESGGLPQAEIELRLESGELKVRAKGEGFILDSDSTGKRNRYALCINSLFIDDNRVDDKGRIDIKEMVSGFPFTSLLGLVVKIVDVGDGKPGRGLRDEFCTISTAVVLEKTVTSQDLQ